MSNPPEWRNEIEFEWCLTCDYYGLCQECFQFSGHLIDQHLLVCEAEKLFIQQC
jgi:hypothetical protein